MDLITSTRKFTYCPAYMRLRELAKEPIDLAAEGVLTTERVRTMWHESCGFRLLYGTERVTPKVIGALRELAKETRAVEKMGEMQAGKKINCIFGHKSEERAVLHTSMRAYVGQVKGGTPETKRAKKEYDKLATLVDHIDAQGHFSDIILIGIGGSDLGPRALCVALQAFQRPDRKVHFISNVDPDDATQVLSPLDLKTTLVVVVSKSGTTEETLTNERRVRERFKGAGLDPKDSFIAVTGEGSPMDNPKEYMATFYIWDYVGGRYSATSMVGGVVLAFILGLDGYREVLRGAHAMDMVALHHDVDHNLPLFGALIGIWNRNFLNHPTLAVLPYSQALSRFTAHLQQCDMESNGKSIVKNGEEVDFSTGPVIWGEPGTNGQHSFFQLLHQGSDVVPVEFIGFAESQYKQDLEVNGTTSQQKLLANLFAQSLALAQGKKESNPNQNFPGNRPNSILLGKRLTPYSMGTLLAYYEHKIAFQGFIWGLNSFDQAGVELGKKLASSILDLMGQKSEIDFPLGNALLSHLDSF